MVTLRKVVLIILLGSLGYSLNVEQKVYKALCESSDTGSAKIKACYRLGKLYYYAKENKTKNYKTARKYLEIACKEDEVSACYMLSAIYYQGLGVDKNFTIGNKYSLKACNLGNPHACQSLGYVWSVGQGTGKIDKEKSAKFLDKACQNGVYFACMQLADYLSYKNPQDYQTKRVKKLYKMALNGNKKKCDKKNGFACGAVGSLYALGKGEKRNWHKAIEYFNKECQYNSKNGGCINLGYSYLNGAQERNATKAVKFLEKGCKLKFGFACSLLGDIYYKNRSKKEANNYYTKAIKGYTDLADEYNILYDFNKLYEISIIQNRKLDKKLEDKFLSLYKNYEQYLINYKILKLFELTYHGKNPNIQEFIEKYKNVKIQKEQIGYDFPHLKVWINNMQDKTMKKRLMKLYREIQKHFLNKE